MMILILCNAEKLAIALDYLRKKWYNSLNTKTFKIVLNK